MINIYVVLGILFTHWVADFLCQTHKMSIMKSKSNLWLSFHIIAYTGVFLTACIIGDVVWFKSTNQWLFKTAEQAQIFVLITFVAHWLTDYFTSRLNSKLWAENKVHWFFVSVGFDQFLHFTQLFLTYYYLTK